MYQNVLEDSKVLENSKKIQKFLASSRKFLKKALESSRRFHTLLQIPESSTNFLEV
jgi:hypothetical protein